MQMTFDFLREVSSKRAIEWNNGQVVGMEDLSFRAMELGGEAGEALNKIKKLARHLKGIRGGKTLEESKLPIAEELADVVICCDRVAELLQIDLGDAIVQKFNKTSDEYGLSTRINPAAEINELKQLRNCTDTIERILRYGWTPGLTRQRLWDALNELSNSKVEYEKGDENGGK